MSWLSNSGQRDEIEILGMAEEGEQLLILEHSLGAGEGQYDIAGIVGAVDLFDILAGDRKTTLFGRIAGESMRDALRPGDVVTFDTRLSPHDGQLIVAYLDGHRIVKRLRREEDRVFLVSDNPLFPEIEVTEYATFSVLGVVTHLVRALS